MCKGVYKGQMKCRGRDHMATVLSDMKYWVFLMESQDCALQNSKSTGRALGTLSVQRLPFTETQRQDRLRMAAAFLVFHESLCVSLVHS